MHILSMTLDPSRGLSILLAMMLTTALGSVCLRALFWNTEPAAAAASGETKVMISSDTSLPIIHVNITLNMSLLSGVSCLAQSVCVAVSSIGVITTCLFQAIFHIPPMVVGVSFLISAYLMHVL